MFSGAPFTPVAAHTSAVSFETPGQHRQCPCARAFRKRGTALYPDRASTTSLSKMCTIARASWHSPDHLPPPKLEKPQTGYYLPLEVPRLQMTSYSNSLTHESEWLCLIFRFPCQFHLGIGMMGAKSSEGRNRSSTRTKETLVIQTTISWNSGRLK